MNVLPMMSEFSIWAYKRIYDACAELDDDAYREDRGLFFGSVHATLNHLLVVDRLWFGRLQGEVPALKGLSVILYDDFAALRAAQEAQSASLRNYVAGLGEDAFGDTMSFRTMDGVEGSMKVAEVLITMFNHQTHHRGQVSAMLTQAGLKYADLDVPYFLKAWG